MSARVPAYQTRIEEEHRSVGGVEAKAVVPYGFDGSNLAPVTSPTLATIIQVVGPVTYLAQAAPGTATSTAAWRVRKIDATSGTVITWADLGNFSQVATDPTTLTYT